MIDIAKKFTYDDIMLKATIFVLATLYFIAVGKLKKSLGIKK